MSQVCCFEEIAWFGKQGFKCLFVVDVLLLVVVGMGGSEEREYTLFGENSSFFALGLFFEKIWSIVLRD